MADGATLMSRLGHSRIGSDDGRYVDLTRAHTQLNTTTIEHDVDDLLDDLTRAIVNVTTATDPGHVVLGGPLAHTTHITHDLTARIHRAALTELDVTISPLGQNAPLDGTTIAALELAREHHATRTIGIPAGR